MWGGGGVGKDPRLTRAPRVSLGQKEEEGLEEAWKGAGVWP